MLRMHGNVLLDSSAWIEYFRRRRGAVFDTVDELLNANRVTLCGAVEGEIARGIRLTSRLQTTELHRIAKLFVALPYIDTWEEDYEATSKRMTDLRRQGITIPVSDCLIGVLCVRYGLCLLTLDKHFNDLPEVKRFPVGAT